MSISRKENGSLVKKAGLGIIDNILNKFSNRAISNSAVTNQLSANDNLFKAAYQNGKYGFTVDGNFYEIGGGGMPTLNYTTPLHSFSNSAKTYTATKDCYLVGTVAQGVSGSEEIISINGKKITATPASTAEFIFLKLSIGDKVVGSNFNSDGKLHVFGEKS